ncbi:MAG: SUMF1/EgtB/PvdO family nonheme iron enzyme [Pirellulaceae bacterium]
MNWHRCVSVMAAVALAATASATRADINLDLVTVGNLGNAADSTGYGAVDYVYAIGKYEVTNGQYSTFLNAKAAVGDPNGLYNTEMNSTYGGITRNGSGTAASPWVYSDKGGDANWANRPVNWVSFWDAARFVNWMHNGQGNGDTESGAYVNVGDHSTFARLADARYWIPTENEWYKATYHKNDGVTANYWGYPTSSDSVPSNDLINPDPGNNANFTQGAFTIGSPYYTTERGEFESSDSPYGTFDQGGNLGEWNEEVIGSSRGLRGGSWILGSEHLLASFRGLSIPTNEQSYIGFRVASVSAPEPSSIALMLCGALGGLLWWKRRKQSPLYGEGV